MPASPPPGEVPPSPFLDRAPLIDRTAKQTLREASWRMAGPGWLIGVPMAVIALGAIAVVVANGVSRQPRLLLTVPPTPPEVATQAKVSSPAPAPPIVTAASATPKVPRHRRRRYAARIAIRSAPSATDSGTDISATAPLALAARSPP